MNEKEAREILNWPKSTVDELYAKAESYLEVREKARVLEEALEYSLNPKNPFPMEKAKEALARFRSEI